MFTCFATPVVMHWLRKGWTQGAYSTTWATPALRTRWAILQCHLNRSKTWGAETVADLRLTPLLPTLRCASDEPAPWTRVAWKLDRALPKPPVCTENLN